MTTREPEFDSFQRNALAAALFLESNIGPHGQPLDEAMSVEADPNRPGGWRYVAPDGPSTDFAAAEVARAQKAYYDKWPDVDRSGHMWSVKRVEMPAPADGSP